MPGLPEKRGAGGAQVSICWNSCGGLGGNARFTMVSRGLSPPSSLPRSEWTPCRQSAALRRKSVGTSAAPPALRASAARGESRMESAPRPVRQSAALRGKAVGTSAAHIRRAAVRGLGTFTWGFLRHSPASVLARGKNRRDARIVSVGEAVLWPCCVRQAREIISVCL